MRYNLSEFGSMVAKVALVAGLRLGYDSEVSELLTLDATRKRGCTVSWVARFERLHGCMGCVVAGVQLARA